MAVSHPLSLSSSALPELGPADVHALDRLLKERPIWRGRAPSAPARDGIPTGFAHLDAVLPGQGWIAAGLNEVLVAGDGVGELDLLWPMLAQASQEAPVALIAPPYMPYAPAWHAAGVRLDRLHLVQAATRDALWAAEQCMRSGACAAVLCWPPMMADDRPLRRLQVAAESGRCRGVAIRPLQAARNPSPAPLRLVMEAAPRQIRVLKCRGANPPTQPVPFPRALQ
ncbi:translesion DNA synthesis-associated protein ImuA [Lysobacter claricitrinus]|uniref:translesion DNA synthesis-associated protein ImuA n=1 Tax=Lysobacter claricitrinus TaxID=3367728 RepID=UPI0037DB625E